MAPFLRYQVQHSARKPNPIVLKTELAKAKALLDRANPNPDEAIRTLTRLVKRSQSNWLTYHYLGVAQLQKGEWDKGFKYLQKAIERGSDQPETLHLISVSLTQQGKWEEAEEYARLALDKNEEFFACWLNLGSVYKQQGKLDEALNCYKKANALNPKSAAVAFRIADIYKNQGDLKKAIELFEITIRLDENYLEAHAELSVIYQKLKDFDKARECCNKMLEIDPQSLGGLVGLAEIAKREGRYDLAIEQYEKLEERYSTNASVIVNHALCLQETGQFDKSEEKYRQALAIAPDLMEAFSNYLMGLHYNPDRSKEEIFEEHLKFDELFAQKNPMPRPVPVNKEREKRLRVGLLSGGLRKHPVGWMITSALENLPVDDFDVYCYSTSNVVDDLTRRINKRSIIWRSLQGYPDDICANIIREDKVDILIELSGHSEDNKLRVISMNPAPVTVKWVGGLFNTTGLQSMDYLITDQYESPEGDDAFYTEKLVRMPDDYICFLPPEYAPQVEALPAERNGFITFGCFNNPTKVNEQLILRWAEILQAVPGSKLFLKSKQYDTKSYTDRIVELMKPFGISSERFIFEGEDTHDVLLDAYNRVDIALDPHPYSGGLSTCEALWMGVPVISIEGPTFAGRHASTHLHNAGLGEYVTRSWENYIAKAVELAGNTERLSGIRQGLRKQLANSPLCNAPLFGQNLGRAFREMWYQRVDAYQNNIEEGKWASAINLHEENKTGERVKADTDLALLARNYKGLSLNDSSGISYFVPDTLDCITTYSLYETGSWVDPEIGLLDKILNKGDVFVDAGAGYGAYTLPAAKILGEEGAVYAFEAQEDITVFLNKGIQENNLENITVFQKAAGCDGKLYSLQKESSPEFAVLKEHEDGQIDSLSLDAWWENAGRPEVKVLKADCNGMRKEIIDSARSLISAVKPVIILISGRSGEDDTDLNFLLEEGYTFWQYLDRDGVLAEIGPEEILDVTTGNVVVLSAADVIKFKEKGILADPSKEVPEVDTEEWDRYSRDLPMSEHIKFTDAANLPEPYLKGLSMLAAAENNRGQGELGKDLIPVMKFHAAMSLMDMYNAGNTSTSLALTLSRLLNDLGKKAQAAGVLSKLIEQTNFGQQNVDLDWPFVLPFVFQDKDEVKTAHDKWIMVKIIEAWLHIKDTTSFTSEGDESRMLDILTGNPELNERTKIRCILHAFRNSSEVPREQLPYFTDVVLNNNNGSELSRLLESHFNLEPGELNNVKEQYYREQALRQNRLFSDYFWEKPVKYDRAVEINNICSQFSGFGFSTGKLLKVLDETAERRTKEESDLVAFFMQSHALACIPERYIPASSQYNELVQCLDKKGWLHKRSIYKYWFDKAEFRDVVEGPEVSAVIISNKFKEKSVRTLKNLSEQLSGIGEIVFVNNGRDDDEFESLMPYINTYIRCNGNSGAYLARNMGSVFAKGSYLLFIDDDGIPDEGLVSAHLKAMKEYDAVACRGMCYSDDPSDDPVHYSEGDEIKPAIARLEGNSCYRAEPFFKADGWGDYILFGHGGVELNIRMLSVCADKSRYIYTPDAKLNHNYVRSLNHQHVKNIKQSQAFQLLRAKHPLFVGLSSSWPEKFKKSSTNSAIDSTNTVWLLDPGLHIQSGHHFTYAKEFGKHYSDKDEQLVICTHKAFKGNAIQHAEVKPVFSVSPYQKAAADDIPLSNSITSQELDSAIGSLVSEGDTIVMHTAGLNNLQGIIDWFNNLKKRNSLKLRICLQEKMENRFPSDSKGYPERVAKTLDLASVSYPACTIKSAPDAVSVSYQDELGYKADSVGCIIKSEMLTVSSSEDKAAGPLLYISSGREVQGVNDVLDLAEKFASGNSGHKLKVFTGYMKAGVKQSFEAAEGEAVDCITEDDPLYSYSGLIAEASAVILPYDPDHFKDKLSGILLDVLATGTPVLVTRGTYLHSFIQQFEQVPGVTIPDYTPAGLKKAVEVFYENPDSYIAAAESVKAEIQDRYHAAQVIKNTVA